MTRFTCPSCKAVFRSYEAWLEHDGECEQQQQASQENEGEVLEAQVEEVSDD